MSDDDAPQSSPIAERQPSAVADVQFTAISDTSSKARRPVSSRGQSFRREKEKWSLRGERLREKLLTPPKALVSKKSESRVQGDEIPKTNEHRRTSVDQTRSASSSTRKEKNDEDLEPTSSDKRQANGSETSSFDVMSSPASSSLHSRQQRQAVTPSMDPAQLVQMALKLSENRRRHASNPVTSSALRRPLSSDLSDAPTFSIGSDHTRELPNSRASSARDPRLSTYTAVSEDKDDQIYFSPATLARAEKARKYFELADKHRRLLQQLPPVEQSRQTGRARAFSRVSARSHTEQEGPAQLGRPYNPLQAIRNRKLRQQQDFDLLTGQFRDADKVEHWIAQIEQANDQQKSSGRAGAIQLPTYEIDPDCNYNKGHKRGGTADTVITKAENDWTISPAELLADTYWIEQGQNSTLLQHNSRRRGTINRHRASTIDSTEVKEQLPSQTADDAANDKVRHSHRNLLPLGAANRLRQHKFSRHRSASVSSASSTEGQKRQAFDLNTGPLQRHMNQMIERDAEETASSTVNSPDRWETTHTRHKSIDHHYHHARSPRVTTRQNGQALTPLQEANGHIEAPKAGLSSPDSSYPASPVIDRIPFFLDRQSSLEPHHEQDAEHQDNNAPIPGTSTTDFGGPLADKPRSAETIDPTRLSVEAARPATFRRHKTTDSVTSIKDFVHSRTKTESSETSKEPASAVTRFLRGGRDMVRNESVRFGNRIRGRDRRGADMSDVSAANSDASDAEGGFEPRRGRVTTSAEQSDVSPRPSLDKQRPRYHVPLPSFKPPQARDGSLLTPNDSSDHISRQSSDLRKRNRSPRFDKLAPPRIALPGDDNEPRYTDLFGDRSGSFDGRRKSYGFLNPALRNRSRSHSKTPSWLGRTRTQNNASVLSPVSTNTTAESSRQWSISDKQPPGIFSSKDHGVSSRDVARVRTLLLASGIKAREISRRLNSPSIETPAYLLQTAELLGPDSAIEKRPSKSEPVYAFQMLSGHIEETLKSFSKEVETFQTKNLQALITRQDKLKARVADELTELVHSASDQADAFNIELSTQATLRTKSIDDVIDAVLRLRRRQFRLLRLAAFKMLEWFTLGILWLVWFVVVCVKTVQRIIVGIFKLIQWLIIF